MVLGLLGFTVGCGAFIVLVVTAISALAKSHSDTTASEIQSGHVSGLLDFHPGLLAELSSSLVGSWHYYRPMGGSRTYKLAGKVPSWRLTGNVIAISSELTPRRGEGRITIAASNARVDLVQAGQLWHAALNGVPLGAIQLETGRIYAAAGGEVGLLQRDGRSPARLVFRGVDLAMIHPGAHLVETAPAGLRPLLQLSAGASDWESCGWVLAIVGLELGFHLMPSGGMVLAGVP